VKGCIFSIEEFSVYDGPGIRTSVFLKGCPLKCSWCHNPEGQRREPEIVRSPNGCIACNSCVNNAIRDGMEIVFTQKSIDACPMGLLRVCGEYVESSVLCRKVLENRELLVGGGVTFSGGEPFVQSEFLFECLTKLKGTIHTAVQTCGYCTEQTFRKALDLADYFLFDIKLSDDDEHKRYTGVSNKMIQKNFTLLCESKKSFVVRIPLIPGVTDTEHNIIGIIKILKENGVDYVELLPYNKMAGGKYKMVGRKYLPDFDESKEPSDVGPLLDANGVKYKIL